MGDVRDTRQCSKQQHVGGQYQGGQHRHFDLEGFDLFAQIFRRPSDHKAGNKDRQDGIHQHAVESRADAAEDHLAGHHIRHRDQSAERCIRIVHRVDRAAGGIGCYRRKEGGAGDPKARFFTLHVAAAVTQHTRPVFDSGGRDQRVAPRFLGIDDADPDCKEEAHGSPQSPALLRVADIQAERVNDARPDQKDRKHLQKVRQGGRVLERVSGVRIERPAAVGSQHLNCFLRRERPAGDHLRSAFQRLHRAVGVEVLHDTLLAEHQCINDAQRQQDVQGRPGQVHPEVANAECRATPEAAHQGDCNRDARGRREEVVRSQRDHLREIRHRILAGVRLPVCIGCERNRRVERQIRGHGRGHVGLIVPGQECLEPQDDIGNYQGHDAEEQHRDGISRPGHLLVFLDASDFVDHPLNRAQNGCEPGFFAFEDAVHESPEWLGQRQNHAEKQQDLKPA